MQTDETLTTKQAADKLGVDYSTVRRWATSGKLPSIDWPGAGFRFRATDIESCLKSRTAAPNPNAAGAVSNNQAFVTGYAMIPVLVKIPIAVNEGDTESGLMRQAKQCCESLPGFAKGHIVPGTHDEDSIHSFEPSEVEFVDG